MNICLLISHFTTQILKRFIFRRRPAMYKPNWRAFCYFPSVRSSSVFSYQLTMSPMLAWIILDRFTGVHGWQKMLICFGLYIWFSLLKIVGGSIFPSDAILTIITCVVDLGAFGLIKSIGPVNLLKD